MLIRLHEKDNEEAYVCLIDVAKAYPSMPHPAITYALQAIGTPQHLIEMIRDIYHRSTLQYGSFEYSLERGVKEGYPLSPLLFVLVYEAFHHTLATDFPELGIYVYMADIAIVANHLTQLKAAMNRISELSQVLGFQVNPGKIELYHWAAKPQSARVIWNGQHIKARSPVFSYLGHMIAHPVHASLARSQILAEVKSDLNRYKQLPLNAFERVQLVNSVLTIIPRTLRDGDHPITKAASRPVHHTMVPLRDYVHTVEQIGGTIPIQMDDRQRPQGGPELVDEEDSEDGDMLRAQERVVGLMEYRAHYHGSVHPPDVDDTGTLTAGFSPIMVGSMVCYTNGNDKTGTTWYDDGSKQNNRAGVGIQCGQLEIIARVTGPQTSYRAELQGAAILSCLADQEDELVIDNKAVVDYGATTPHRECSDVDLRQIIETHQAAKQLRWRWIPSHKVIKRYHTEKEKKDIKHNDVVDRLAKLAAKLPLPWTESPYVMESHPHLPRSGL